uniref:Uncharacterized protein n=1 Tax=Otus sunia TaxID=257818 RepID=A0A8C8BEK0_9STRI
DTSSACPSLSYQNRSSEILKHPPQLETAALALSPRGILVKEQRAIKMNHHLCSQGSRGERPQNTGLGGGNLNITLKGRSLTHKSPTSPDELQETQFLQMHGR